MTQVFLREPSHGQLLHPPMQAVQTNAKITGLLDPEYARERAFYSHISKVPESVQHAAVLMLLILCSRLPLLALELPGVHPSEPCHGAAGVGGHGSYHPIGQRMKEVEAVHDEQNQCQDPTSIYSSSCSAGGQEPSKELQ